VANSLIAFVLALQKGERFFERLFGPLCVDQVRRERRDQRAGDAGLPEGCVSPVSLYVFSTAGVFAGVFWVCCLLLLGGFVPLSLP
jgi:hypothetical protein